MKCLPWHGRRAASWGCLPKPGRSFTSGNHTAARDATTGFQKMTHILILLYFVAGFFISLTSIFIHGKYHNKSSVSCRSHPIPHSHPLRSLSPPPPTSHIALPLSPSPLSSTSLYLCLIANAGSIAAAIDLCAETPSRQEKWRPAQSHFLRGCKSGRKWLLFHRHCRY